MWPHVGGALADYQLTRAAGKKCQLLRRLSGPRRGKQDVENLTWKT
jgi:hypothetical protein